MLDINQVIKTKFPYLSDDKLDEIIRQGEIIVLNHGDVYLYAGERVRKVGVVLQGLVRNYIMRDNGQEITVAFASEMEPVAPYTSIFLNQPSGETCRAVERSLLFSLDFDVFKSKIDSDPFYTRVYSDIVQESLVAAIARIEDFANKSPEQRYQRLLDTHGYLVDRVPLKYLASYIGITAVSLSRIRKRKASSRTAA